MIIQVLKHRTVFAMGGVQLVHLVAKPPPAPALPVVHFISYQAEFGACEDIKISLL